MLDDEIAKLRLVVETCTARMGVCLKGSQRHRVSSPKVDLTTGFFSRAERPLW